MEGSGQENIMINMFVISLALVGMQIGLLRRSISV